MDTQRKTTTRFRVKKDRNVFKGRQKDKEETEMRETREIDMRGTR